MSQDIQRNVAPEPEEDLELFTLYMRACCFTLTPGAMSIPLFMLPYVFALITSPPISFPIWKMRVAHLGELDYEEQNTRAIEALKVATKGSKVIEIKESTPNG
jgi:hypothetical protein